jgi:8-oxo-dGTP pyrophosphatase MutT (NUDIX family)
MPIDENAARAERKPWTYPYTADEIEAIADAYVLDKPSKNPAPYAWSPEKQRDALRKIAMDYAAALRSTGSTADRPARAVEALTALLDTIDQRHHAGARFVFVSTVAAATCRAELAALTAEPSEPTLHGVVFCLVRDGKILLEQCPKKRRVLGVGEWFVPGGKIKSGEGPAQAMLREMREELGVVPTTWEQLPVIEGSPVPPGPKGTFLMRPYLISQWAGDVPSATLDGDVPLRWTPIEEAIRSDVPQVRAMAAMCGAAEPSEPHEADASAKRAWGIVTALRAENDRMRTTLNWLVRVGNDARREREGRGICPWRDRQGRVPTTRGGDAT